MLVSQVEILSIVNNSVFEQKFNPPKKIAISYMLTVLFGLRCWSNIGREYSVPGAQELSIGEGCNTKGIITHELMHALGFWHEQSRTDRDNYIAVLWENIKKGSKYINNNATLVTVVVRDGSDKLVSWPLVVLKALVMLSCIICFEVNWGSLPISLSRYQRTSCELYL